MDHKRVFRIRDQIKNIYLAAKSFVLLKKSKKHRLMNKKLKERIMLAVTEVNGCSMCSFVHTKLALSSGMSSKEINNILDGIHNDIPIEDSVAVVFAQHFADSSENPSGEALSRLIEEYGSKKSELILAACNVITMTNGMGTSMDYLYSRLKFNRNKESNIVLEILNPLLTMVLFPLLVIGFYVKNIFSRPRLIKAYN